MIICSAMNYNYQIFVSPGHKARRRAYLPCQPCHEGPEAPGPEDCVSRPRASQEPCQGAPPAGGVKNKIKIIY